MQAFSPKFSHFFGFHDHLIFSLAKVAPFTPSIAFDSSLIGEAEDALLGMYRSMISPKYLSSSHGSVGLTHVVHTGNQDTNTWYEVHHDVDADLAKSPPQRTSSQTMIIHSRTRHHYYIVVPIAKAAVVDREELASSPSCWVAKSPTAYVPLVKSSVIL